MRLRRVSGRVLLGAGGLAALLLTPVLALAYYYPAYGTPEGSPTAWLAKLIPTFTARGWIGGDNPGALYARYGRFYGLLLLLLTIGLLLILKDRPEGGRRSARGWRTVTRGLGAVALGTIVSYSGTGDALEYIGFAVSISGFLATAIGTVLLGLSLWHDERRRGLGTAVALVGPASLTVGTAATGHIPSGTASLLVVAAVAISVFGLWEPSAGSQTSASPTSGGAPQHP